MISNALNGVSLGQHDSRGDAPERTSAPAFGIQSAATLFEKHSIQSPPIIDGLLRRRETMNIIAAPKLGKSWLAHGLAKSIATGEDWLGFATQRGRVLLVDAELHPSEISTRLRAVLGDDRSAASSIDVMCLRGRMIDVNQLATRLQDADSARYELIVVDALYRFLPDGCSENDNSAMMKVYNNLDSIAESSGASIAIVHHTSKGSQSSKSITDVGSGAGAISRATDTHLTLRPHQADGHAVVDAVCRSFAPPQPFSIQWDFPHWIRTDAEPKFAMRSRGGSEKQRKLDAETDETITACLKKDRFSVSELRSRTPFGPDRIKRSLKRLGAICESSKSDKTGKEALRFRLPIE